MGDPEPTVAEWAALVDVRDCTVCHELRAAVLQVIDDPDPAVALPPLRRWNDHKEDAHPVAAAYLRS